MTLEESSSFHMHNHHDGLQKDAAPFYSALLDHHPQQHIPFDDHQQQQQQQLQLHPKSSTPTLSSASLLSSRDSDDSLSSRSPSPPRFFPLEKPSTSSSLLPAASAQLNSTGSDRANNDEQDFLAALIARRQSSTPANSTVRTAPGIPPPTTTARTTSPLSLTSFDNSSIASTSSPAAALLYGGAFKPSESDTMLYANAFKPLDLPLPSTTTATPSATTPSHHQRSTPVSFLLGRASIKSTNPPVPPPLRVAPGYPYNTPPPSPARGSANHSYNPTFVLKRDEKLYSSFDEDVLFLAREMGDLNVSTFSRAGASTPTTFTKPPSSIPEDITFQKPAGLTSTQLGHAKLHYETFLKPNPHDNPSYFFTPTTTHPRPPHHINPHYPSNNTTSVPPEGYICKLCLVEGHWLKQCTLYNKERALQSQLRKLQQQQQQQDPYLLPSHPQWSQQSQQQTVYQHTGVPPEGYLCRKCQIPGHWIHQCPYTASSANVRVQGGTVPPDGYLCKICGIVGHWIQQCPLRQQQGQQMRVGYVGQQQQVQQGYRALAGRVEEGMYGMM
ncbi:hypothetical protein HDV05_004487 [Chytridiales sp. JEL 0842]|nr:hypothetical protein HDV05_004487 [Chytridiales sp. JEL 0842]